ncbi:hypothetical protein SAMN05877838_2470 [Hoeflea halophila]|uniref:Protein rhiC n=1 Tax=Hoeflea halophila TaxID=714899 RepID=A0A286IE08_9HYPH|nr:protein rhiC [Hoeflea halophila]SOE17569.1 hypothetical protein SAMN05877838_2470 [Hoeflea halophila]
MNLPYKHPLPSMIFALAATITSHALAEEAGLMSGVTPVTTGVVIRGVTIGGPGGTPGTKTGEVCSFGTEEVDITGRMLGASVNCRPGGNRENTLQGLPVRFDAYCVINAPVKSARLIEADVPGNPNHCDLSGITPGDATGQFKGSIWR